LARVPPLADPITFAGSTLDRAAERRSDAEWVAAARTDPRARAIVAGARGVRLDGDPPAPQGGPWTVAEGEPVAPMLVVLDDREPILLGLLDGAPLWVVEAREDDSLAGLRESAPLLSGEHAGLLAYAQQMVHWRRTHRFCGTCGQPSEAREGGHMRICPNEHQVHPRTDPVVIMLVTDGDRVLLGRQPVWPPGRYSALAGFVEPGETLESAVAREVFEEAGLRITDIRYRQSQPWPFPASLMLGFHARWESGEIGVDENELEDARWFTRDEVRGPAEGDPDAVVQLPPPLAIARRLVDLWLAEG